MAFILECKECGLKDEIIIEKEFDFEAFKSMSGNFDLELNCHDVSFNIECNGCGNKLKAYS